MRRESTLGFRIERALMKEPGRAACSTSRLAAYLQSNHLAITATCKRLERQGTIRSFISSSNQWASRMWVLTDTRKQS
jgi:hypothetical protein